MSLFDTVPIKKPFEVLRMEVRLGNKKKIKQVLEQHNEEIKDICFERLFSSSISKRVLIKTITKIESEYPKILSIETENQEQLLTQLMIDNPKISYKRLLPVIVTKVILQEMGTRKFRQVTDRFGKMSWYRLNAEMQSLTLNIQNNPFTLLIKSIQEFKKVSIEKYKEKM